MSIRVIVDELGGSSGVSSGSVLLGDGILTYLLN